MPQFDLDEAENCIYKLINMIARKVENSSKDKQIQDFGYESVNMNVGFFSFDPDMQDQISNILIRHFSPDHFPDLSIRAKYEAARLAINASASSELIIRSKEDASISEFPAFLDHYTKYMERLQANMHQTFRPSAPVPSKRRPGF